MMKLVRRPRVLLLGVLTVALIGVGYIAPGAAQEASLSVTPSTGLVAGQVIHIEAEAPAGTLSGVGICPAGANLSDLVAASGACLSLETLGGPVYSIDHAVTRTIQTSSAQFDCFVVACSVVLIYSSSLSGPTPEVESVPLSFAHPGPLVTVDPAAFLDDLDPVQVSFNDAQAGVPVRAVECVVEATPLPDGAPGACVDLGLLDGSPPDVSATVAVRQFVEDSAGTVQDCELVECRLGVAVGDGTIDYFLKRVRFDTNPLLEVTPSTGLVSGDVIHIEALMPSGLSSGIGLCSPDSDLSSLINAATTCLGIRTLGGPAYSLDHVVQRVTSIGGQTVDCFVVECRIVALGGVNFFSVDVITSVPLVFAPPPAEARVEPDTNLHHLDVVNVIFNAASAGETVMGVACVVEASPLPDGAPGECVELGALSGSVPNVSRQSEVPRWIVDSTGTTLDCFAASCRVGVRVGDGPVVYHLVSVQFSADPVLSMDPFPGLLSDGDALTFTARNLPLDNVDTTLLMCAVTIGSNSAPLGCADTDASVSAAGGPSYESVVTARRFMTIDDITHDCAKPRGTGQIGCALAVTGFNTAGDVVPAFLYPLQFRLKTIADLAVTPAFELGLEQVVDVTIDPASPDSAYLGVCPAILSTRTITNALRDCVGSVVGAHPAFSDFSLPVDRILTLGSGGTFDCSVLTCHVTYLSGPDPDVLASTRLTQVLTFEKSIEFAFDGTAIAGVPVPINAIGFRGGPGFTAAAGQCGFPQPISLFTMVCAFAGDVENDFDGDFDGAATLQRFMPVAGGDPVDCDAPQAVCAVLLVVLNDAGQVIAVPGAQAIVVDAAP